MFTHADFPRENRPTLLAHTGCDMLRQLLRLDMGAGYTLQPLFTSKLLA